MRSAADAAPSFLYVPDLATQLGEFTLAGDEARYLTRVVRVREGECVTGSDGAGLLASLRCVHTRPKLVLRVEARRLEPAPARARLLCGAPEGERGDWLVEKLAELGVTELVPVQTQRVRWDKAARRERWQRLTVAALRQSRSAWQMRVLEPVELAAAVVETGGGARWLADPAGGSSAGLALPPDEPVTGVVGPSAGFSDDERKLLGSQGFVSVRLAMLRLRTETAAVSLAALWAAARARDPDPPAASAP